MRTYDSRLAYKSEDFGFGWELDIGTGSVQNTHPLGDGWVIATDERPFHPPCEYVIDQEAHRTVVQLSDRERYVFVPTLANAQPFVGGCRADIFWDQVEGTTDGAELFVLGNGSVRATGALVRGPNDPVSHGTLIDADLGRDGGCVWNSA